MAFERLQRTMDERRDGGLYRERRVVADGNARHLVRDGRQYLNFSSNDYLGLAQAPAVIQAAADGAREYGVGSGGSALVTGNSPVHQRLEIELCEITGQDGALLFSSGFAANSRGDWQPAAKGRSVVAGQAQPRLVAGRGHAQPGDDETLFAQ